MADGWGVEGGYREAVEAVVPPPGPTLPGRPRGAALVRSGSLAAYLFQVQGVVINGRYCGATVAAMRGKPILKPYTAEVYTPGSRVPVWRVECGTAGGAQLPAHYL